LPLVAVAVAVAIAVAVAVAVAVAIAVAVASARLQNDVLPSREDASAITRAGRRAGTVAGGKRSAATSINHTCFATPAGVEGKP